LKVVSLSQGGEVNLSGLIADTNNRVEPSIAVNPMNNQQLDAGTIDFSAQNPANQPGSGAACAPLCPWLATYYSTNGGGVGWTRDWIPRAGNLANFDRSSDPVIDFDSAGFAYYAGLATRQPGGPGTAVVDGSVFVAKSGPNGGLPYRNPVIVENGTGAPETPNSVFDDKPWIAVDKNNFLGNIYVTWTSIRPDATNPAIFRYDILFSVSTDLGKTFSVSHRVNDVSNGVRNQFSQVSVGPKGEVYVSWVNCPLNPVAGSFPCTIFFSSSTNSGSTFQPDIPVSTISLPSRFTLGLAGLSTGAATISMAVDTSNGAQKGAIYIAYPRPVAGVDKSDIMLTSSNNQGAKWNAPVKLNDDKTTTDQFYPAITVSSKGIVKAVWYDRRSDPANNNIVQVYYTESSDGGSTLLTNTLISVNSIDPNNQKFGDYIGIAATGAAIYAIWTRVFTTPIIYTDISVTSVTSSQG
jgi:hypothetical protein